MKYKKGFTLVELLAVIALPNILHNLYKMIVIELRSLIINVFFLLESNLLFIERLGGRK